MPPKATTPIETTHESLSQQWHPLLNGDLTPSDVTAGSNKKVWWLDHGHEWPAMIISRTNGAGCPFCAGVRVLAGFNDVATRTPELVASWHPTLNGTLRPSDVIAGSAQNVWWIDQLGHSYEASPRDRAKGCGCPYCAGKRVLPGFNDLATTHPPFAVRWHPTRNGDLTPEMVTGGSNRDVWWLDHGHEWHATVKAAVRTGCSVCSNRQVQVGVNDLATTDPEFATQWHPTRNGDLTPQMVTRHSTKRVWWLDHGHEWHAVVDGRVRRGPSAGCAVCRGFQVQVGVNDLESQEPEIARLWHPSENGSLTAEDVTTGSSKKVAWLGDVCGHSWWASVGQRVRVRTGCGECAKLPYQQSRVAADFCEALGGLSVEVDLPISWVPSRPNQSASLDGVGEVEGLRVAFEFDGRYHAGKEERDLRKSAAVLASNLVDVLVRVRDPRLGLLDDGAENHLQYYYVPRLSIEEQSAMILRDLRSFARAQTGEWAA